MAPIPKLSLHSIHETRLLQGLRNWPRPHLVEKASVVLCEVRVVTSYSTWRKMATVVKKMCQRRLHWARAVHALRIRNRPCAAEKSLAELLYSIFPSTGCACWIKVWETQSCHFVGDVGHEWPNRGDHSAVWIIPIIDEARLCAIHNQPGKTCNFRSGSVVGVVEVEAIMVWMPRLFGFPGSSLDNMKWRRAPFRNEGSRDTKDSIWVLGVHPGWLISPSRSCGIVSLLQIVEHPPAPMNDAYNRNNHHYEPCEPHLLADSCADWAKQPLGSPPYIIVRLASSLVGPEVVS